MADRKPVTLHPDHLIHVLASWTGISPDRLRPGRLGPAFFSNLERSLAAEILGQERAVAAAVAALRRASALASPEGPQTPLWTAYFGGPSGVGKTGMARALARMFFGAESALIQIDCAEFDQEHTLARLVGAPPGYVGYHRGGQLCDALRRTPQGVILFDEIEKGHSALLRSVLMPLLGEAVVHDMSTGERLNVSEFAVILTSNLGAYTAPPLGFTTVGESMAEKRRRAVESAIEASLPKEIAGRVNDIIVFDPLSVAALRMIWERDIRSLEARIGRAGSEVRIEADPSVFDLLRAMYESEIDAQGARALRRVLDRTITDRCLGLISGGVAGAARIRVFAADGDVLHFELSIG